MTIDERGWSLADQAAAWVPPWERATPARPEPPAPSTAYDALAGDDDGSKASGDQTEESPPPVGESSPSLEPSPARQSPGPPGGEEAASECEEAGPGGEDAGPGGEEAGPGGEEAGPGGEEAGPGGEDAPPEDEEAGPGGEDAPPEDEEPEPESEETAPPVPLALAGDGELRGALEAILLVVDEPVSEVMLAQVLEQPTARIRTLLSALVEEYAFARRGFELRQAAGGWRLYTRPEYASYVERFVLDGQQLRLTQAALETLAVVAYKQPVTRSRVSAIRGVNCDSVIRTLVSRGLVEECGAEPDSGAYLYRTTTLFLEKLGLNSVHELPPLAPFLPDNVDEITDAQH